MPFMPAIASQIRQTLGLHDTLYKPRWEEAIEPLEAGHKINIPRPLFKKIDVDEKELDDQLMRIRAKKTAVA